MRDAQKGRKSWLERLTSPPESETEDQAPEPESAPVHEQPRAPWADQGPAAQRPWAEQVREAADAPAEHPLFRPNQPPAPHPGAAEHPGTAENATAQHAATEQGTAQNPGNDYRPGDNGQADPRAAAAAFAANAAPAATGTDPFEDLANESTRLPGSFEAEPTEAAPTAVPAPSEPEAPAAPAPEPASAAPEPAFAAQEPAAAPEPAAEPAPTPPANESWDSSEQSVSTNLETHGEPVSPSFTPADTSDHGWQPPTPHHRSPDEHVEMPESVDAARNSAEPEPSEEERLEDERRQRIAELQHRWLVTQAQILDDPRDAVREAGLLIGDALQFLTSTYSGHRDRIERTWKNDDSLSTDELRDIMRRYRGLFQHAK